MYDELMNKPRVNARVEILVDQIDVPYNEYISGPIKMGDGFDEEALKELLHQEYNSHQAEYFISRDNDGLSIRGIHGFLIHIDTYAVLLPKFMSPNFILINQNYNLQEFIKAMRFLPKDLILTIPISLTRNNRNEFVLEIIYQLLSLDVKDVISDEFVSMVNILET